MDQTANVSVSSVISDGLEMEYAVFGSGDRAFVILPGLSVHSVMGSAGAVADAYAMFGERYTVYLFDPPKELPDGYRIRDLAADTARAMKALGITQADVFGASLGGMVAQYLAIDHPELVRKMVLGSTLCRTNEMFDRVVASWIALAESREEDALLASFADTVYSNATLAQYRDYLIASGKGITDAEYRRFLILARACVSFDCSGELSRIACPVLVLGSEGDRAVTAEGSREIAAALGCGIFLYPAEYGHAVYDEAPDYKQKCLDFFLTE